MGIRSIHEKQQNDSFRRSSNDFQRVKGYVHPEDLVEIVDHNLTEAVFRCSFEGQILYVNDAFLRLFDINTHDEVLGKYTRIFYQDQSKAKEVNQYLEMNGSSFQGDVEFTTLKGKPFHGHLSSRRVHRDARIFIDGVIRDITSEIESEQKMKRQLQVQEMLLDISSAFLNASLEKIDVVIHKSLGKIGVFFGADRVQVHDYDFKKECCISSYEWKSGKKRPRTSDYPPVPIRLLDPMVGFHKKGKHIFLKSIDELPEGEIKSFLQAEGILSSLTIPMIFENLCVGFIALDSVSKPVPDYSNSTISFLKLFANMVANISFRGRNHVMLKQLVEKVTIQAKKHKDFSFIASHNIRASSANLQAISELLSEDYNGKYLAMLTSTIARLNESVTNINRILNLENDVLLRRTRCDVIQIVEQVLQEEKKARFSEAELTLDVSQVRHSLIFALPGYLENILIQILSNAMKYGINDEDSRIIICISNQEKWVIMQIQDFGNGFDYESYSGQVFEVGSRFHRHSGDGQGLGLYIVKQQMESLNGSIDIYSQVNRGTTVTLRFPVAL